MTPSVGRIVHYVSYGTPGGEYESTCRAAIITEVSGQDQPSGNWRVNLFIMNPEGLFLNKGVIQREGVDEAGTWHWPERVEELTIEDLSGNRIYLHDESVPSPKK